MMGYGIPTAMTPRQHTLQLGVSVALVEQDDSAEIMLVSDHATHDLVHRTKRVLSAPLVTIRHRRPSFPGSFCALVVEEALQFNWQATLK
eukprot:CAMPEP_0174913208 /NCGR_PEP_ID=MMETSP0167-20121228/80200_1 /TAXON_ID=38298 /ORGANISM="Rhodella maculata, Strain CCMP736" /LENGTH=89 /DNA_ID=CAMNT_0016157919 /DNA_START=488 /DNA_END=754 /DNA_ORIENTATION=+